MTRSEQIARWFGWALLAVAFFWAHWPTWVYLADHWVRIEDYSHGFLVVPLAGAFAWARRGSFPGQGGRARWFGLMLVAASVLLRYLAAEFYLEPVDGWALVLWVGGVVWYAGGWRVFRWALPSVLFLFFMIPLPFRVEQSLSLPLQRIATWISSWTLQTMGLPAFPEGNTILLGSLHLEVERACSGLRIFFAIFALAYVFAMLVPSRWWEKAFLFLFAMPVAIVANSGRIVATGLAFQWTSDEAAKKFAHDMSGWVMVPFAALLFAVAVWYFNRLFPKVEQVTPVEVARDMLR